jgi:hypothetical protein
MDNERRFLLAMSWGKHAPVANARLVPACQLPSFILPISGLRQRPGYNAVVKFPLSGFSVPILIQTLEPDTAPASPHCRPPLEVWKNLKSGSSLVRNLIAGWTMRPSTAIGRDQFWRPATRAKMEA